MRLSKPWKIVIGVVTAWEVIFPFLTMALYFFFIFTAAAAVTNNSSPNGYLFPFYFFPFFFIIFCSTFLQFGLQIFYLIHVILNKTGNDLLRVVLGILAFFFSPIGMPIYYFIFIWPETPPTWAQSANILPATYTPSTTAVPPAPLV